MEETRYGLKVSLPCGYDEAIARTTDALKAQGFGVLTTIDVKQTLKAKLDRDFRKYIILGACNPQLADRALRAELEIGLLLPCNVVIYEMSPSASVVAAMAPLAALDVVGENAALTQVAHDADGLLRQTLTSLELAVTTWPGLRPLPRHSSPCLVRRSQVRRECGIFGGARARGAGIRTAAVV